MRPLSLLLVFLLAFASCDSKKESLPDKQQIMNVLIRQQNDWNAGDVDAYMQGYWKSPKLRFASGNRTTFGWENTLKNYKKTYPDKLSMGELFFTEISIEIISKEDALVFGRWQLYRNTDIPNGLFTLRFHKFQDNWKIISDHTSASCRN
jgi:hypothetical protein